MDSPLNTSRLDPRLIPRRGHLRKLLTRSRLNAIERLVHFQQGEPVLEVGCDQGVMLRMLETKGLPVYGVEINGDAVRAANHARILQGKAEALPFKKAAFDYCIASHIIEHLDKPQRFLIEACRVLSPGGKLVLLYPCELFLGMTVIPDLLVRLQFSSFKQFRQYHRHRITPQMLQSFIRRYTPTLVHLHSKMFIRTPMIPEYISIFEKVSENLEKAKQKLRL